MMDIEGVCLLAEEKSMLCNSLIGGVILFSRNFESSQQLIELIESIKLAAKQPILIAVDHEGGRVQRFRSDGFTHIPAMGQLLPYFDNTVQNTYLAQVQDLGWLLACECLAHQIDISFSPVLDLDRGSDVIGDRAFSSEIIAANDLARAWCQGFSEAGMACIGKHFPGHGSTKEDSHIASPVDDRNFDQIEQEDMAVFRSAINNELLQGIMPAHILFKNVDNLPVGYSYKWLQQILKQQLGFNGVIFSDDLSMEGAGSHLSYSEKAQKAHKAGCDMMLICNDKSAVEQVLTETQSDHRISKAQMLIAKHYYDLKQLQTKKRWQNTKLLAQQILQ